MVYIWVFDTVEDDILARHNKHFSQAHYHFALRGVIMLHYQRHNLPRALRALTSATTNIRNCSICRTKFFPLAMLQLWKLSTARNNCQNYRILPFSPLCATEWDYASTIHILLKRWSDLSCNLNEWYYSGQPKDVFEGANYCRMVFVLFSPQQQRRPPHWSTATRTAALLLFCFGIKNKDKISWNHQQQIAHPHLRWHLAAQSTAEHPCLWRLSIDNRHKLEYFGK